jgi:hypothetical protein
MSGSARSSLQQLRIVDERHGELEQLLLTEGEIAGELVALAGFCMSAYFR